MDTIKWMLHPSNIFMYATSKPGDKPGVTEYENCILTRFVYLEAQEKDAGPHPHQASFHNEAYCSLGARFSAIATLPENVMYGWDENGELVLDVPYRTNPLSAL